MHNSWREGGSAKERRQIQSLRARRWGETTGRHTRSASNPVGPDFRVYTMEQERRKEEEQKAAEERKQRRRLSVVTEGRDYVIEVHPPASGEQKEEDGVVIPPLVAEGEENKQRISEIIVTQPPLYIRRHRSSTTTDTTSKKRSTLLAGGIQNTYSSHCCSSKFKIDRRLLTFLTQTLVILTVLIFAMYQAVRIKGPQRETYVIIITTILSVYLPSPTLPNLTPEKKDSSEKKDDSRR